MPRFQCFFLILGMTLASASVLVAPLSVSAQGFNIKNTGVTETANKAGYQTNLACASQPGGCIPAFAGTIINALAGLFGAFFFALILFGGFQYMTAGGDKTKTEKARTTIVNAIIGMIIVASSYAIASYVLSAMGTVTTGATAV
jgi:hypothetical protein